MSGGVTSALVFDSGLGGLTVLRALARQRPDLRLFYAADDAAFPYGRLDETAVVDRTVMVVERLLERLHPDLVVIACNTASTVALPTLRSRFSVPFVGTVPAIKPACAQSRSKRISVLATPATVRRDYTRDLIREFAADCEVTLVAAEHLAGIAERALRGGMVDEAAIRGEIAPCFVGDGAGRTDAVVLACTHYPLILDRLERLAPWPVAWVDPAPAIARRAAQLLAPSAQSGGPAKAYFTSGQSPDPQLARSLAAFGVVAGEPIELALPV